VSVESYIESLQDSGQWDSKGVFTLDQAQALQKMRRYQVSAPEEFSAALVGSAVAAGASAVCLQAQAGDFRLEHDGAPIPYHHLTNLFSSVLVSGPDQDIAPVQELAYALNALLSLAPTSVRVTCSGPGQLTQLELSSRQLVISRAQAYEVYGQGRRTVVEANGIWKGLGQIRRRALGQRPELEVLRRRCRHAGLAVLCNGEPLVFANDTPEAIAVARMGEPPALPFAWPATMLQQPGEFHAWVGLCPGSSSVVTVVMNGVSFPVLEESLPPALHAIIYSSDLRKDLSHAAVVRDESYQRCLEQLRSTAARLMDGLAEQWRRVPRERRMQAAMLLKEEARRSRELRAPERADRMTAASRALRLSYSKGEL
jgi:hypothetical protein